MRRASLMRQAGLGLDLGVVGLPIRACWFDEAGWAWVGSRRGGLMRRPGRGFVPISAWWWSRGCD